VALLFMDSFDHYTAPADKGWDTSGSFYIPTISAVGRFAGGATLLTSGSGWESRPSLLRQYLSIGSTGCIGFAFKYDNGATQSTWGGVLVLWDGVIAQLYLNWSAPGFLSVYRGNGTLLGTGTISLIPGYWYYIEFSFSIADSGGSFELRVNGNTSISGSGLDTRNAGTGIADSFQFRNNAAQMYFDDVYAKSDGTFLGDCRVECLYPSGAGAETQWTPVSGANYQNVDETPANGDTDYNKSNTVGQVDTYAMADLVAATGLIYGVQYLGYARKDNAGTRKTAPVARIGGADYVGSDTSLGTSYVFTREVKELSPATAAAWTISEINAMEYGVKVTA
jgi:hypothetical protein